MKHWGVDKVENNYAHIYSPTLMLDDPKAFEEFKEKKQCFLELKLLENDIKEMGLKGWFTWTLTSNPHIMRLLTKVKAKPYLVKTHKNPKKDAIWFFKELEV